MHGPAWFTPTSRHASNRQGSRSSVRCKAITPMLGSAVIVWASLLLIGCVHLFAGHLRFLSHAPRSRWLSAGGGVSVASAFLHLLPELQVHQRTLREAASGPLSLIEHHAYLLALLGLAAFYGLEHWAKYTKAAEGKPAHAATSPQVFWVSISAFVVYNALLGYLIGREGQENGTGLVLFALAVAVHFAVNDHGMYHHHRHLYARYGRWLLAGAAAVGGIAGHTMAITDALTGMLMAFLIGAMILNVLKEELPEERDSRFGAFALGAFVYAVLLLIA